jgi:hypothetical protein
MIMPSFISEIPAAVPVELMPAVVDLKSAVRVELTSANPTKGIQAHPGMQTCSLPCQHSRADTHTCNGHTHPTRGNAPVARSKHTAVLTSVQMQRTGHGTHHASRKSRKPIASKLNPLPREGSGPRNNHCHGQLETVFAPPLCKEG